MGSGMDLAFRIWRGAFTRNHLKTGKIMNEFKKQNHDILVFFFWEGEFQPLLLDLCLHWFHMRAIFQTSG